MHSSANGVLIVKRFDFNPRAQTHSLTHTHMNSYFAYSTEFFVVSLQSMYGWRRCYKGVCQLHFQQSQAQAHIFFYWKNQNKFRFQQQTERTIDRQTGISIDVRIDKVRFFISTSNGGKVVELHVFFLFMLFCFNTNK